MTEFSTKDLIAKFERDIESIEGVDTVMVVDRVDTSLASEEIIYLGRSALPEIISHLEGNMPAEGSNRERAWRILIDWLSQAFVCKNRPPFEDGKLPDWIAWAKRESA